MWSSVQSLLVPGRSRPGRDSWSDLVSEPAGGAAKATTCRLTGIRTRRSSSRESRLPVAQLPVARTDMTLCPRQYYITTRKGKGT